MRFAAAADSVIPGPGGSGWTAIYAPNGKLSFVSPDGGTTVSSVAKAQQWHKKQVELAAQFQARRAGGTERSLAATAATPCDASTAQPSQSNAVSCARHSRLSAELVEERELPLQMLPEFGLGLVELEA